MNLVKILKPSSFIRYFSDFSPSNFHTSNTKTLVHGVSRLRYQEIVAIELVWDPVAHLILIFHLNDVGTVVKSELDSCIQRRNIIFHEVQVYSNSFTLVLRIECNYFLFNLSIHRIYVSESWLLVGGKLVNARNLIVFRHCHWRVLEFCELVIRVSNSKE